MTTIYVNTAAPPAGDGLSWATAYQTLQPALVDAGTTPGSQIWIATGSYFPGALAGDTFTVPDQTNVYGGFAGTETALNQRNPSLAVDPVYLDGAVTNNVVMTVPTGTVLLDRLYFKQGLTNLLVIQNSTLQLSDSFFSLSNQGININNSIVTITNCDIGNIVNSTVDGAAIYADNNSQLTVANSLIHDNSNLSAGFSYGLVTVINSKDFTMTNSRLTDNSGGLYCGITYISNSATAVVTMNAVEIDHCVITNPAFLSQFGYFLAVGNGGSAFPLTANIDGLNAHDNRGVCYLFDTGFPGVSKLNLSVTNSIVTNNIVPAFAGAVYLSTYDSTSTSGNYLFDNVEISFNTKDTTYAFGLTGCGFMSQSFINVNQHPTAAPLTIKNSTIKNNTLTNTGPSTLAQGSGVLLVDVCQTVTLDNITVTNNSLDNSKSPFGSTLGGSGICLTNARPTTLTNSLIQDNYLSISNPGGIQGGAGVLYNPGGLFILASNPSLLIDNCVINNNTANNVDGGGLLCFFKNGFNVPSSVLVQNTEITENTALNGGGAVFTGSFFNPSSTITMTNCKVNNNVADHDGGGFIINTSGSMTVQDTEVKDNLAQNLGGGAYVHNNTLAAGLISLSNLTVSNNSAQFGYGGGVAMAYVASNISNSTVSKNNAKFSGGGWYSENDNNLSFSNVTFNKNNSIIDGGAATFKDNSAVQLDASTIQQNKAQSGYGGGIFSGANSNVTISNSLVSQNNGTNGGGIATLATTQLSNTEVTQNKAIAYGGGLYGLNTTLDVQNSHIHNNNSSLRGGAMAVVNNISFNLAGSHIHNNVGLNPGGVYIQNGTSTITGNNIHNDTNFEVGWTDGSTIGGQTVEFNIKSYLTSNNTVNSMEIGQV